MLKPCSGLRRFALVVPLAVLGSLAMAPGAAGGYHLLHKYSFEPAGDSTREYFDYITVDSAARRVYLSRGTEIEVIDADDGHLIGNITGFKKVHGVAIAHEFGRGFITDGAQGKVIIFDLRSLKIMSEVKADSDADSVAYDPASGRVFAQEGDPHTSTVIDAKSGSVAGTLQLGGAPEFAVADGRGTVYINLESTSEMVAVDSHSLQIKSRWPVAPAGKPTALAIDTEHRRLFSAGRNPALLVVMNADTGAVIQSFPISAGVDAAAFDPATGMIFASTREGFVHVFHEDSPDEFSSVESIKTEVGAKTMGLDSKTHRVFVDTADFGPPSASGERHGEPLRGTFHVLVYGE